jgi:hypothetical protein
MVSILPNGIVTGEVLDHYDDPVECFSEAVELGLGADPGLAFTCVEDYVDFSDKLGA